MSIIATALKHLIAAGMTGDDLVRAVAEMEEHMPVADTRSAGAKRQARYREALAERNKASQNVTCDDSVTPPPFLDKETPPTPPKEINSIPRGRDAGARGTVLPIGWKPGKLSHETISGQIIETRGQDWARRSLESFENHWRAKSGKDAAKRDWQAAWANWVIEQDRRDGKNGTHQPNSQSGNGLRGQRPDPSLDLLRASRAAQSSADRGGDYRQAGTSLPAIWTG